MRYLISYELDANAHVEHGAVLALLLDWGARQILKTTWLVERPEPANLPQIARDLRDSAGPSLRLIVTEAENIATYQTRTTPAAGLRWVQTQGTA